MRRPLFSAIALGLLFSALPAASGVPSDDDEPKVLAVVFAADWCGACKVLDPKFEAVKPSLDELPLEVVTLDFTDNGTRSASARTAAAHGVRDVFDANAGRTGFILLVDADSQEVLGRILHTDSRAQMRQKVRRALAQA